MKFKFPVIKVPFKIFGNVGIAWFFPFIIVYRDGPHVDLTIKHETVHMIQWLEILTLAIPVMVFAVWVLRLPLEWLALSYLFFHAEYLYEWLKAGRSYELHVMEIDAKYWADRDIADRPFFFWV
ncbi:MAG: hypothetical protein Unbinned7794contig1000_33 [Prokaryotic dsDNA virus sp.]|nr:MAG: hypothetical protein Unbinned7794contig1000_33 [Prokaryotic dsDNA virus sp.]|tara:strand:+ start:11081 stop:11452 length:372 start_codon:yes stop_codon:yes gene_type:complete